MRIQDKSWLQQYGHLSLRTHTVSKGRWYKSGTYSHPKGMVEVYTEPGYSLMTTVAGGQTFRRYFHDTPALTFRQISNLARKFLLEKQP